MSKKRKQITFDIDSEEEEIVAVEIVNKIIFDYLLEIGFKNTSETLKKEKPLENPNSEMIKNVISNFSQRVMELKDSQSKNTTPIVKKNMVDNCAQTDYNLKILKEKHFENEQLKKNELFVNNKTEKALDDVDLVMLKKRVEKLENYLKITSKDDLTSRISNIEQKVSPKMNGNKNQDEEYELDSRFKEMRESLKKK